MDLSLRVAEIFDSLQGEGIRAGNPSTFVRVSGCNLRCSWCDTPYASWNPEGGMMTLEAVAGHALQPDVVLTGGEPMVFDAVEPLAKLLRQGGRHLTIETAGTVFRDVECDLMSVSPKLSNSTPDDPGWARRHEATRLDRGPLRRLVTGYRGQLKFVVNPEEGLQGQLTEIDAFLNELPAHDWPVLLMSEGVDDAVLARREQLLAPLCLERGWRLCPRLHIRWFGNTRAT